MFFKGTPRADIFGPHCIDGNLRSLLWWCWLMLPEEERTIARVEAEVRRLFERAMRGLPEDVKTYGCELPPAERPQVPQEAKGIAEAKESETDLAGEKLRGLCDLCWWFLPENERTASRVEAEMRRIFERAMRDLHEDARAFGCEKPAKRSVVDAGTPSEDTFGPHCIDHNLRGQLTLCWLLLPEQERTIARAEAEMRRLFERAMRELPEDVKAYGREIPPGERPQSAERPEEIARAIKTDPFLINEQWRGLGYLCWHFIPENERTLSRVEAEMRRIFERAMRDLHEDAKAFGCEKA